MIDEGVAFCPQCNAPQIRVAVSEMAPLPPSEAEHELAAPSYMGTPPSRGIDWPQAFSSAAWAGIIAALALMIPLGAFVLGTLAAGALSVLLYRRHHPNSELTPGMGARLGAASGVIGFGIASALLALSMVLFHSGGELRALLMDALQQSAARNPGPQTEQVLQFFKSPQGFAMVVIAGMVMMFLGVLVFTSIGGALGASLLRRKEKKK